jgi:DUF2934 family protein
METEMSRTHEEIRDRAYALWVDAGSPDGREEEFWHQAEAELAENGQLDRSEQDNEVQLPPIVAGIIAQ